MKTSVMVEDGFLAFRCSEIDVRLKEIAIGDSNKARAEEGSRDEDD